MVWERIAVHTLGMRRAYPMVVAFALAALVLAQHAWGRLQDPFCYDCSRGGRV